MVGYRAASHFRFDGGSQVYARRDRNRAFERTEDSREITDVGHLFERHRRAPSCLSAPNSWERGRTGVMRTSSPETT